MYVYLSKLLPLFVMPLGVTIMLMLVGLGLLASSRRRGGFICIMLSLLVLWVTSMPILAETLYRRLEAVYPPVEVSTIEPADCMVLLGGAVGPLLSPRTSMEFNEAADRVITVLELYRLGKAPTVIVSAGNQPWSRATRSEAELVGDFLIQQGVPKSAILLEGSSRNTRENAVNSRVVLQTTSCVKPLLITSAAHMPRSVAAFLAVGVSVVPVSTDVRVVGEKRLTVMSFVPDIYGLALTSAALREWIGQRYYQWKGWA